MTTPTMSDQNPQIRAAKIAAFAAICGSVLALIGTIWATAIGAPNAGRSAAQAAITEERQRMSGGTVSNRGEKLTSIGRPYTVAEAGPGRIRITFDQKFDKKPVALLTTYQEGSPTVARVEFIDERSLLVSVRNSGNGPAPAPFSFMVLESLEQQSP